MHIPSFHATVFFTVIFSSHNEKAHKVMKLIRSYLTFFIVYTNVAPLIQVNVMSESLFDKIGHYVDVKFRDIVYS
ncbi:hypothetical protein SDC9_132463 [bioreactor metagenome]|uniref:Uncharacterized protein n=1 Tax=bioreactor metagenome TaxID=1076179 RepID=A0A645D8V7_9ZZZZ